ncbi:MAG: PIN domain-containing protein [Candidatus Jacksonbacteria bacterium]
MPYFLDTNIFLRFLIKENKKTFNDCERLFSLIEQGKIKAVVSSYVMAEIVWVLLSFYKFDKNKIIEALRVFQAAGISIKDQVDFNLTLILFEKYKVKFIDCLIASQKAVQNKKMTIISYDQDFDKFRVKRIEPDQI